MKRTFAFTVTLGLLAGVVCIIWGLSFLLRSNRRDAGKQTAATREVTDVLKPDSQAVPSFSTDLWVPGSTFRHPFGDDPRSRPRSLEQQIEQEIERAELHNAYKVGRYREKVERAIRASPPAIIST